MGDCDMNNAESAIQTADRGARLHWDEGSGSLKGIVNTLLGHIIIKIK